MKLDWRFWLGAWYGLRKCVEQVDAVNESQLAEVEGELLQRLELELDLTLAMPPRKPVEGSVGEEHSR